MKIRNGESWDVLDHGFVKLVDFMGGDKDIIEAARMSTNKGFQRWDAGKFCEHCCTTPEENSLTDIPEQCASTLGDYQHSWKESPGDRNLLEYLWENGHATPFEMCELTLEVQAPIMVFREWHRHRTMSFNELSARYSQMPDTHYLPPLERIRTQSKRNKQGSGEPVHVLELAKAALDTFAREQKEIYSAYAHLLNEGVAKEIARLNTPVSRYSRMRVKTDLRNWLGFLKLRMAPNAQWEIQQYANIVGKIISLLWPRTWAIFEEHTLGAVTFSKTEAAALSTLLSKLSEISKEERETTLRFGGIKDERRMSKFMAKLSGKTQ